MKLNGRQIQEIRDALLDAYPTHDALRMMVRIKLNENLEDIAGGENQRVVVFNLVSWAERTGRVEEMIAGAYSDMQGNPALDRLVQWWKLQVSQGAEPVITSPLQGEPAPAGPASIDLFLSYSRKDTEAMHTVLEGLRAAGLAVWSDVGLEPGTDEWQEAIKEALDQAPAVVVLLSPNAKASQWVRGEILYAQKAAYPVFPLLIRGDAASAVPPALEGVPWVDGRADLKGAVETELLAALRRQAGEFAPQPLPVRTPPAAALAAALAAAAAESAAAAGSAARTDTRATGQAAGPAVETRREQAPPPPQGPQVSYRQLGWSVSCGLTVLLGALVVGIGWYLMAQKTIIAPASIAPTEVAVAIVAGTPTQTPFPPPESAAAAGEVAPAPSATPTAISTPTEVPTIEPPTSTPSATPSATATATLTPTLTPTVTPTEAPTQTPIPEPAVVAPAAAPATGATTAPAGSTPTRTLPTPPTPLEIEFVTIPGGTVIVGAQQGDRLGRPEEKPPVGVALGAFEIARTEVTNGQYARCVAANVCTPPNNGEWSKPGAANYPVTNVTWEQANTFAAFAGGRLPTEAEWEKACRGPSGYNYPWGYIYPTRELANYHNYFGRNTPVKKFSPKGDSAYGLADMAGNVWEWTSSQDRPYPYAADDGREDPAGDGKRIQRGGGYLTNDDGQLRCAARWGAVPEAKGSNIGFRIVR